MSPPAELVPHGIVDAIKREVAASVAHGAMLAPELVTCSVVPVGTKERIGLAVIVRYLARTEESQLANMHAKAFDAVLRTSEMWIGPGVAISVVLR